MTLKLYAVSSPAKTLLPGRPTSGATQLSFPFPTASSRIFRLVSRHWYARGISASASALTISISRTMRFAFQPSRSRTVFVSVALANAQKFGFTTVGCSSTGNLANSVAAQAARLGLKATILVPADLEPAKILNTLVYGARLVRIDGNYDHVNRLCTLIADEYSWGFVNVNLRPYYAEGSKSVGYEIAEQLGWRLPDNVRGPHGGGLSYPQDT